jgi:hypothetical protein
MGRGGATTEANAGVLLFGARARGQGPQKSQLSIRQPLDQALGGKQIEIQKLLALSSQLAPGPTDKELIDLYDRHGVSLWDQNDVYATGSRWVNDRTGAERVLKIGLATRGYGSIFYSYAVSAHTTKRAAS